MSKVCSDFFSNRVNRSFSSCTLRNDFCHGKHLLPSSILQVALHAVQANESIGSQFLRGKKSYGLLKLGTTPEFTINTVSSFNLLLSYSSSLENSTLNSIQKDFFFFFGVFQLLLNKTVEIMERAV